ncbi:lysozyme inhibitor LprI family protein [Phenylobacterium hankyongense]|uniref:lysozyme inhibitor LprI family protein n=1 Tax=Phenylobacterium hankyongense TaxID=1813876 RepID=UPI00105813B9|nr:lysozyme inhibitor LprI family protein [Phenylobacterium hankyongense]
MAGISAALGIGLALGYFVQPGFQRGAGVPEPVATAIDDGVAGVTPAVPGSEPMTSAPKPAGPGRVAARAGSVKPAFHCDWALRPSERMVCNDAQLAQYDRQLNRAFTQAVRSGVPRAQLRAAQDRWVLRREQAARRSREAVADLYRRRIAELNALADNPS